jgi:ABC-type polysaccharide/polyol phosphate transport system ATPase subunit
MSVIVADGVAKRFLLRHSAGSLKVEMLDSLRRRSSARVEEFWALRDVSFHVAAGESVGLIGRNGSGKSTLLKLVAGIQRPSEGHLLIARQARLGTMIELGLGFHMELSGAENTYLNAAIHGLSRAEIDALYPHIVEYAGLARFMDVSLKSYSSGMQMRLAFAIAAQMEPDILLLDEVFAVGDQDFQLKCMRTLKTFRERGCSTLFVSHAASSIRSVCSRVLLLERGRLVVDADVERGFDRYERVLAGDSGGRSRPEDLVQGSPGASPDREWHRRAGGPRWSERGAWQLEFLRGQGLTPDQFLFDVGCGDFSGAPHFLQFMDQSHYWGYERHKTLFAAGTVELARAGVEETRGHFIFNDRFDFSSIPVQFDFVLAGSLFVRLPLNQIAHCIAASLKMLKPGGTLFATWYDADPAAAFDLAPRGDGFVTHGSAEPYHYTFGLLQHVCEALGARVERLDVENPAGESVLAIRPMPPS